MNIYSETIFDYAFYTKLMSDTFLYILYDNDTLIDHFKEQQHGLITEITIDSPFNRLLKSNKEAGNDVREVLNDFYEFLFTTEKYLQDVDGKVVVKHEFDLTAASYVLDYLCGILPVFEDHAKRYNEEGNLEEDARNILLNVKGYSLFLAFTTLYVMMEQRYFGFNKVHAEKPEGYEELGNRYATELQEIYETYAHFKKEVCESFKEFEVFTARIDLMIDEFTGKTQTESLSQVFQHSVDTRTALMENVNKFALEFNKYYVPMIKEIFESHQENMNKAN